jgi:hypothetical protein
MRVGLPLSVAEGADITHSFDEEILGNFAPNNPIAAAHRTIPSLPRHIDGIDAVAKLEKRSRICDEIARC